MPMDSFYATLPKIRDFGDLSDPSAFAPLPADWHLCCTDIVNSTGLVREGRYKTVNMVGAAVIAAMRNALAGEAFPYVFGGDGASFAVPPHHRATAQSVLGALRSWTEAEYGISLRAAMLPASAIRAKGLDVKVARYAVSDHADFAMFSGGGLAWAEAQMKAGLFAVDPAPQADPPDLAGLSCRWSNTPARHGIILSLVAQPAPGASPQAFARFAAEVLSLAAELEDNGHPVPESGPKLQFPPAGLSIEAQASHGRVPLFLRKIALFFHSSLAGLIFLARRPVGGFDPVHYLSMLRAHSDFRKFDDGLKMTLDCTPAICERIRRHLQQAADTGLVQFGLHEQDAAMVTCIVPSPVEEDHIHFVDGAAGGYTQAAANLAAAFAVKTKDP
ncbi:adenylate cyclase [Rhodobacteraceae bacterium (ex Bugula neritina AB1)]|nr:adenylate cyclase [Rhodobacteraceae bacterium (ex Bugula neritina AB1)]